MWRREGRTEIEADARMLVLFVDTVHLRCQALDIVSHSTRDLPSTQTS